MSFSRFGKECDVYTFYNTDNLFECCGCMLPDEPPFFYAETAEELMEHLVLHVKEGHQVPEYLFDEETYERDYIV